MAEHVLLRLVPRPVELRGFYPGISYTTLILAALAAGDVATAADASDAAWPYVAGQPETAAINSTYIAQVALARGDLTAARRWADQVVSGTTGWHLALALTVCARITIAHGEWDRGERGAHDALACAAEVEAYLGISDTLECLADLAAEAGSHREATRLFGAADAIRTRMGAVRFKIYDPATKPRWRRCEMPWVRRTLNPRGPRAPPCLPRSRRLRPAWARRTQTTFSDWGALTPAERDVVRLVSEGLGNKDIATRLFVSPRTVQTHLTHVYTKLGVTSRVQLAQEAARRA